MILQLAVYWTIIIDNKKMITMDSSKQQTIDVDLKAKEQTSLTENLKPRVCFLIIIKQKNRFNSFTRNYKCFFIFLF